MFFKRIINRTKLEWQYFTKRPWSLKEVGEFWDTVDGYDKINEKFYTYNERFFVSKDEFFKSINNDFKPKNILDIQTRSGNGTIFWNKIYPDAKYTCVDFSKNLIEKAKQKTKEIKNIEFIYIDNLFDKELIQKKFDFILCYETLEHVYEYQELIKMLSTTLNKDGYMILTTPNVSWEIIHWITAIIGYNHSEGPHRFISYKKIEKSINSNNLKIISYKTSIFLPFNNKFSIYLDKMLTKVLPNFFKKKFFLRHIYILKKN